ncbi:hypothetical protein [Rickettsia felis]|uniref:hypothetical protein n=1 Tax=Rickettsia felis TaxID=42862 RepID=UPI0012E04D44|nr:hypothetical protein [Rickettsia felis]
MMNQGALQSKPNNPQAITFPEGKNILATTNTSKGLACVSETNLDLQLLYDSIAPVKNVKSAIEMVVYLLNYLSPKNEIIAMQNTMQALFINYNYEEFISNKLLDRYKITKISKNIYDYQIGKNSYLYGFKSNKINNLEYKESIFLKIQATEVAVYAAIKNDHKQTAEELIKEVLKNADLHLTVFSASKYDKYTECSNIIAKLITLLEPESQINAFQILKSIIKTIFTY